MLYAFLLLGLLPLALFPDGSESSDAESETDDTVAEDSITDIGDILDEIDSDPEQEDESDEILQPSDENDTPDHENEDPEDVLPPVIEDDVGSPSDGEEGDVLEPVDEPDFAGLEADINGEGTANYSVVEIEEFDVEVDVLCVFVDEKSDVNEDSLSIKATNDGKDSEVFVEEKLIAILRGVSATEQPEINILNSHSAV